MFAKQTQPNQFAPAFPGSFQSPIHGGPTNALSFAQNQVAQIPTQPSQTPYQGLPQNGFGQAIPQTQIPQMQPANDDMEEEKKKLNTLNLTQIKAIAEERGISLPVKGKKPEKVAILASYLHGKVDISALVKSIKEDAKKAKNETPSPLPNLGQGQYSVNGLVGQFGAVQAPIQGNFPQQLGYQQNNFLQGNSVAPQMQPPKEIKPYQRNHISLDRSESSSLSKDGFRVRQIQGFPEDIYYTVANELENIVNVNSGERTNFSSNYGETWIKENFPVDNGLFYGDTAHSPLMWKLRELMLPIYSQIYSTEEKNISEDMFLASFEGYKVCLPSSEPIPDIFEADQPRSKDKNDRLVCIRAAIPLTDIADSGPVFAKGSSAAFTELANKKNVDQKDTVKSDSEELAGYELVSPKVEPGDVILWDARTFMNFVPASENITIWAFVTLQPRTGIWDEELATRKQMFENLMPSNCWCFGSRLGVPLPNSQNRTYIVNVNLSELSSRAIYNMVGYSPEEIDRLIPQLEDLRFQNITLEEEEETKEEESEEDEEEEE